MDRAEKQELINTLNQVFKTTGVVVVVGYQGLTAAQMNALRGSMAEANATFKVAKNRLVKLALDGTESDGIKDLFRGPTAVAYSADPIAAPKALVAYAKANEKLVILGGALGSRVLDANGVKALAELPSLDELRGKLIGLIQAPATRLAGVLQAPGGQLARVLNAYATKSEAA
ncbi:50S ribosomal protein L10 [Rhodoligotrophos defluvii]|uniref:50S ribosomal protein L10 n=1 Tax=Rhodoligotrophos defluvii TaxID=2561934 RepID=UPI0010CA034E|nr:50S ribosomal protein L10 [Rhodoligotrophos defluvii]